MLIRPHFMFHGDQSIRRASSSSSIRQLVNKLDEIDEKIIFLKTLFLDLDILNANYALYQISWPSVIQKSFVKFVNSSTRQFS